MNYLKPQSPISVGENYIYPLTTSDQIINGNGERVKNIADTNEICYLYSATFSVDSWQGEGPYTQTATLTAVDGGSQVTVQSTLMACVGIDSTLPQETKDAMQCAASDITNAEKTLGDNTISVSLTNKPDVDVELYFLIKEGIGTNVPTLNPVETISEMKLLWKNPNPLISFSPQTVDLTDDVGYKLYITVFSLYANEASFKITTSGFVFGGMSTQVFAVINYTQPSSRQVTSDAPGKMTFGAGYRNGSSPDNATLIPLAVYGICTNLKLW